MDRSQPDTSNLPQENNLEVNNVTANTAQGVQPNHPEPRKREFLQEQHDLSYLRLPIPQGGMRGRICWRCDDTGHSRNTCN